MMMQSGDGSHPYSHPAAAMHMDLPMPQPFPYYSCIMDNNAVFAQQIQYGKMYGENAGRAGRMSEELTAQGSINTRYGNGILEMRKEKSRDAARSRRGKENHEFYELAKMLPLPGAITSQLDKASIIRLTIAYLRLREFAANGEPPWNKDSASQKIKGNSLRPRGMGSMAQEVFDEHEGTHILQSLDGFAISLNSDGRFLYISETVSIYLGLSQVELTGSSFFDYVHQSDHVELAEQLGVTLAHQQPKMASPASDHEGNVTPSAGASPSIPDVCYPVTSLMHVKSQRLSERPNYERAFCIRMKSTLTKRGCHFKSSGYRVVLLIGKLRPQYAYSPKKVNPPIMGFIGLAIALPPPSVHEVRLESDMFVTRLNFDFKIAHCEPKVSELLDYTPEELTGCSLYALCHAEDVHKIKKTHEDLLNKGQVMSQYFRIINRRGGYTWMQACATLVCNTKNSDEQSIICVNYVLSGPQFSNIVMDQCQINGPPVTIKQDCECDYTDKGLMKGEKKSVDGKKVLDPQEDMYLQPQGDDDVRIGDSKYAVANSSFEYRPFWRPPTLI